MADKIDYFQLATGKKISDLARTPTLAQTVSKKFKSLKSNYELRSLGVGVDGEVLISEEERADHMHILGTTGEGKSKFIEHLIREDIRRGNGLCLLDPTDRAETAYNVLKFCIQVGHKKVCLIDPHTERVTGLQPFHPKYKDASTANVMDTVHTTFNTKDGAETPVIQKYLPAILNALQNAELTLYEAKYFNEYKRSKLRRNEILEASNAFDMDRLILEEAFGSPFRFDKDIGSSARRLQPFFDSRLSMMFAVPGVDFMKMISEGWVILVNLDAEGGIEPIHSRLIGTMVINEILFAMYSLRRNGYAKPYYLYIDEAGQYVTDKLIRILEVKRKAGIRVTIAHQGFWQFPPEKRELIKQLTKTKVMFNTPGYNDRLEMIKALGYGGDIPHELAVYANQDLPKQQAVIKVGKDTPKRIKIPDVPDIDIKYDVNDFLHETWNYSHTEVLDIINSRFNEPVQPRPKKPSSVPSTKRTVSNSKTVSDPRRPDEKACLTTKNKPKNLSGTTRLLREMVASKQIRAKHFDAITPDYYFLNSTKSISLHSRKHEHLCGDLYVAYSIQGPMLSWEKPTEYEENLRLGLFPDRQMVLGGKIFFWEIDRGTEDYVSAKGISGKLDKYVSLSALHPDRRFHVIFTTIDGPKQSAKARGEALLSLFEQYRRGNQFLVTVHKWAVHEPLNPVFLSPIKPSGICLLDVN